MFGDAITIVCRGVKTPPFPKQPPILGNSRHFCLINMYALSYQPYDKI